MNIHQLRHYSATELISSGVDITTVSGLRDHEMVEMITRTDWPWRGAGVLGDLCGVPGAEQGCCDHRAGPGVGGAGSGRGRHPITLSDI
jgi:hypothetical protein